MAKQTLFGSGKNAVQQTSHIRSIKVPNGNQGFSNRSLGSDTKPGDERGAPLMSTRRMEKNVSHRVLNDNPYNKFDRDNTTGVVFDATDYQTPANTTDSPVPGGATKPARGMAAKAINIAQAPTGDTFPADGVLGHT